MYARRTRFLILGAVITIGLLGVILLQAPEPTRAVDDLMEDPDAFVGKEIAVRGEVLDGSIDNITLVFTLHGESHELSIDYSDASVSNGLGDNRTVYAQGILKFEDGVYVLEADIIKTSCPSKYEEEPSSD
ncbi:MAG: cytochrome c maturation protein CcmE [Candidatus Poseidoniaceae archaeon]|nr:cytochrome c maturation protein CcmE [Candidatus Poseidoniaceae archaeon]